MNVQYNITCEGLFSKLMTAFQGIEKSIDDVNAIDNIVLNNADIRLNGVKIYDFIFEQKYITPDIVVGVGSESYRGIIPKYELDRLRIIVSKLKIKDEIINKVNEIQKNLLINNETLGVHIRLGSDMNMLHGDIYGTKTLDDYLNAIDNEIKAHNYNGIYVACDNEETLHQVIKIYGSGLKFYGNFIRGEKVSLNFYDFIVSNLTNKKMITDTFTDMLVLSKCGNLIHRVSNFANMSKIYSKHIGNETILI